MSGRSRAGRAASRRVLALCAAAGVLAMLAAPRPAPVEAMWTDAEAARATFTAMTVPTPIATAQCTGEGSLLGLGSSKLYLYWKLPAGYAQNQAAISYTGSAGLVPVTDTLTGTALKTTHTGGGNYTTSITGGLLSAALGGTRVLSVQIVDPNGWQSQPLTATGTWPLLGLGAPSCVVSPPVP